MKIIEITNVDFSLRHFLLPLMRAIRARGHEVVGACAEGPLLDDVRDRGVPGHRHPVRPPPVAAGASAGVPVAGRHPARRKARPGARPHADQRLPGPPGRLDRRGAEGRLYLPRLPVQPRRVLAAPPRPVPRHGVDRRARHRRVPDRLGSRGAGRPPPAHRRRAPRPSATAAIPAVFRPDPAARARIRAELGVPADRVVIIAVSRLVWHKGYPELAAAMRSVPQAELWVVGERLDSDRGADMAALLRVRRPRRTAAHAGLSRPMSRRCWPPPISSPCPAGSRACRCR